MTMAIPFSDPETETVDETQNQSQQPNEEASSEDQLPEKFKGKSAKEIADSYLNLESEVGRTRNELGQVRRLADELLGIRKAELQANQREQSQPKVTTETLLDKPSETITAIARREADERVQGVNERTTALEAELRLSRFERRFPDYESTANDPAFKEWVTKSQFRSRLAQTAATGDFDAAEELFGLYKDTKPAQGEGTTERTKGTDAARKAALARSGGSSAAGVGSTAGSGKEILKRSDLINLRINDPDEYDRRWPEIEKAYREKRVR